MASSKERRNARDVLRFVAPRPWPWLQRFAFLVNRHVALRFGVWCPGRVEPVLASEVVEQLRAVPRHVGNVLVGPHSGTHDPFLMYEMCRAAHRLPAGFLMSSEYFNKSGRFVRAFLSRLGAIPVARGRHNPQAVRYMVDRLAHGRWCGLFPEGEAYYSREIMPLEYGALRIAVEAKLAAEDRPGGDVRLTPFAMAYFYKDPELTPRRLEAAVEAVELREEIFARRRCGEITARILDAAGALLEHKAQAYGVDSSQWHADDRFERVRRLQQVVIEDLERRYRGGVHDGFIRRRAMKVRMRIYEILGDNGVSRADREALDLDVRKTRDLITAAPFSPEYREKYGDLEMWTEYVRRLHDALDLPKLDLGPQRAVIDVLPAIDLTSLAERYRRLGDPGERAEFLSEETEHLRETMQAGVDAICVKHPRIAMPAVEPGS